MDVSLSFKNIVSKCLIDIKTEIANCQSQIDRTKSNIEELENAQKNNFNEKELQLLIQKLNLLLVDNYCLISKQSNLIEYYVDFIKLMNVRNVKKFFLEKKIPINNDPLNELITYYKSHNREHISDILKKYINNFNLAK